MLYDESSIEDYRMELLTFAMKHLPGHSEYEDQYGVHKREEISTKSSRIFFEEYIETLPLDLLEYCVNATRKNEFGPFKNMQEFRAEVQNQKDVMSGEQMSLGANNPYYISI